MSLSDLPIASKGLILVAVPLIFELLIFFGLGSLLFEAEREARAESRTRAIVESTSTVTRALTDGATAIALYWMTHDEKQKLRYELLSAEVPRSIKRLKNMCKDDKDELSILERIDKSSIRTMTMMDTLKSSVEEGGGKLSAMSMAEVRAESKQCLKILSSELADFDEKERKRLQRQPKSQAYFRNALKLGVVAGFALNIILAIGIAIVFTRGILNRLRILTANTERLSKGEQLLPAIAGKDELAVLDQVFHKMAAELGAAYSSLKEREDRLSSIYNNVPVGLLVLSPTGTVDSFNPQAEELFGNEIKGKSISDLINMDLEQCYVRDAIAKPIPVHRSNGKDRFVKVSAVKFQAVDNEHSLLMTLDVTEEHKLAEMKKEFVNMLSHDLRSPLASLQVLLENFIKGLYGMLNEEALRSSRVAYRSLSRLIDLISDLLDLEKAEEGLMELQKSKVDLQTLLDASIESVQSQADAKEISIECTECTESVEADEKRIIRVLVNLLSNAIKFSDSGKEISIIVEKKENAIEVHVKDLGPGLSSDEQKLLFQRYKQTELGKSKGGSGLGLANCKAIIEAHGGSIGVTSAPGTGSDFWFSLPLSHSS